MSAVLTENVNVFRLPLPYRVLQSMLVSLAFFIPDAILLAGLIRDEVRWFEILTLIHLGVFILFFCQYSLYSLTISPSEIQYRSPVHRVRASWDNIEELSEVGGWLRPVQGLHVRNSTQPFPFQALFFAFPRGDIGRSIPLEIFAVWRWQDSQVGRLVRRYAPDLFVVKL